MPRTTHPAICLTIAALCLSATKSQADDEVIAPVSVSVTAGGTHYGPPSVLIDGQGLSGEGEVLKQRHNSFPGTTTKPPGGMWLSAQNTGTPGQATLVFDLGEIRTLNAIHVWNYGEVIFPVDEDKKPTGEEAGDFTARGASDVELYFDTANPDPGGKPVVFAFSQATWEPSANAGGRPVVWRGLSCSWGLDFTVPATTYKFSPVQARYVKLKILGNWGDPGFVGLSEIRFGAPAKTDAAK